MRYGIVSIYRLDVDTYEYIILSRNLFIIKYQSYKNKTPHPMMPSEHVFTIE